MHDYEYRVPAHRAQEYIEKYWTLSGELRKSAIRTRCAFHALKTRVCWPENPPNAEFCYAVHQFNRLDNRLQRELDEVEYVRSLCHEAVTLIRCGTSGCKELPRHKGCVEEPAASPSEAIAVLRDEANRMETLLSHAEKWFKGGDLLLVFAYGIVGTLREIAALAESQIEK